LAERGLRVLLLAAMCAGLCAADAGGQVAPGQAADGARPAPPPPGAVAPARPAQGPIGLPPTSELAQIEYESAEVEGTRIRATGVKVTAGEYVLTGDRLEGDFEKELLFTGNPTLTFREQTLTGDSIRFQPKSRTYRVENLHTVLSPDFLRGQVTSPLLLSGETVAGRRDGTMEGADLDASTCDRPEPHYLLRARVVEVEPGKRIVLRRAKAILWGRTLVTLPTLVIPLTALPRRHGYLPEFGRSQDEGWFVKSAFSYQVPRWSPGTYRVDVMEKKGLGLGFEQNWRGRLTTALASFYFIPTGPAGKNLSGRLTLQSNLGGGQALSLSNDFQQSSYLSMPETTAFNTRLGYQVSRDWLTSSLSLSRQATDTSGYSTRSYTASLSEGLRFGGSGTLDLGGDYTQYETNSGVGASQRTETLVTRLRASERASNYALELVANRNVPIGSTATSYFSGVERLPELTLSNYRFTQGFLSRTPATFSLSAGRYQEGSSYGGSGSQITQDRVVAGFDVPNLRYSLSGSTDLTTSAAFQQYFYSDGAAQYLLRNQTTLTQRWNKRSGVRFNYAYQQPAGGTPFHFDVLGQYHTLNADIGVLDDSHVQFTARVGYDFARRGLSSFYQPWQTVSANLLLQPAQWAQLRNLFSFDPNVGRLQSVTSDLRLRGAGEFALDLVSRYDPQRHTLGQLNGHLVLPVGKAWRVEALMQYNGYLSRFESRNLQIVRDMHCLEASLTYSENPFGYRPDRQIYFQLTIKALPTFRRFGVGGFGQALDTGVGGEY
jgi:hypothetical protein